MHAEARAARQHGVYDARGSTHGRRCRGGAASHKRTHCPEQREHAAERLHPLGIPYGIVALRRPGADVVRKGREGPSFSGGLRAGGSAFAQA